MDEEQAKEVLMAAYRRLLDETWRNVGVAGLASAESRAAVRQSLERLAEEIEAEPAWLEDVLNEVGLTPRPPER